MRQLKITPQITKRDSISLNKYLQEISSISLITQEEEIELSRKIQEGDEEALSKFVKSNLRFVISVAKQYPTNGAQGLDDLVSAGNEGLIIAAKRFDASKGFKFISYAVWWIRQSIMQFLNENSKAIRLPGNKINMMNKIKNVISKLEQVLERTPTSEEISEQLINMGHNIDADEVETIMLCSVSTASLDTKIGGEDSEGTLMDVLQAETLMDVDKMLTQTDLQFVLQKAIDKKLSPKEKEVIISYYGLFGNKQKSLEEIGYTSDLTRERVRQIKEKAIRKLKYSPSSKQIKEYI